MDLVVHNEPLCLKVTIPSDNRRLFHHLRQTIKDMDFYEYTGCSVSLINDIKEHKINICDYGVPWIELHIKMISPNWRLSFLSMVKRFQVLVFENDLVDNRTPILEISENKFFLEECKPSHLKLALDSVHHGNFLNAGHFVSHFKRFAYQENRHIAKCVKLLKSLEKIDTDSSMIINFEHDRDQFVIFFPVLDGFVHRDRNSKSAENEECEGSSYSLRDWKLYEMLSRLHARTGLSIAFANIQTSFFAVERYVDMPVSFIGCDHRRCAGEDELYRVPQPRVDRNWSMLLQQRSFALEYLIAALFSRGAVVKDHILTSTSDLNIFLSSVIKWYDQCQEITLEALERMLNAIDEMRTLPPLLQLFELIIDNIRGSSDIISKIRENDAKEGFQRVRKVVVTPTRTLLVVPELSMGNRVLRNFDKNGDGALRIQFRDDDGSRIRRNSTGTFLIKATVHNTLFRGIHIAGRHFVYLASSNSQMRDNGCYFFDDGQGGDAHKIRKKLGRFDRTNIPKLMSRMGQCFTQSKECDVTLARKKYNDTYDIIGGKDSNGEPFVFSDGVGVLSENFAWKVSKELKLGGCVPSCFQIRHRGIKGVLSVDPILQQRKFWAVKNLVPDNTSKTNRTNDLDILFRPSQNKFHAPRNSTIEVVKYSSPTPVSLNRPLINILDQVSDMQGYAVHKRVTERIHALLDKQLMYLADTMMSESRCRERLAELPRRIGVQYLSLAKGFALTQEPFFHSLLLASAKYTLKKQLAKEQIQIPADIGRSMFGVIDETGLLQYGQVFVQYTKNISLKIPTKNAQRIILKGPVLMTKNPSVVAGDVRVFQAVDIPELRHLVDVVVFPEHGPRPHTDEMAGSDLDGDEYSVFWDKELLFEYNQPPMDFAKLFREPDDLEEDEVVREMRRFFVDYVIQDSIGTIANAFLVNADLYGICSEVCLSIAEKHIQSVDFPKTGQPPKPLEKSWKIDENGKSIPPERPERWPDFMCKNHEPSYVSPRLVGQLFRRIRLVDDVLTVTIASESRSNLISDDQLQYQGMNEYIEDAKLCFYTYSAHIKALLDNYGISDEGQLFSGCIITIRNRISDRDMDDMSLFNTNYIIEQKLTGIFMSFRRKFFDEFGGYEANTRLDSNPGFKQGACRRFCDCPTDNMKKKAAAYYHVCYNEASSESTTRRILSFPWIVWDVLAVIKQEYRAFVSAPILTTDPLCEQMSNYISDYCNANKNDFIDTMKGLTDGCNVLHAIKRYCRKYQGLDQLFYVLCKWGELRGLLEDRLKREHLCMLLIQFGTGHLSSNAPSFLEETDELIEIDSLEIVNLNSFIGGPGKCFLRFLQFLSSRTFEMLKSINFMQPKLGYQSLLMRGQWMKLHRAAVKSFYRIMFASRFDELPLSNNDINSTISSSSALQLTEMEPFIIELPHDLYTQDQRIGEKMMKYSGVKFLKLRRINDYSNDRVIVSAVGTLEALHRLRDIVAVKPTLSTLADSKTRSEMMLRLVYERLSALPD